MSGHAEVPAAAADLQLLIDAAGQGGASSTRLFEALYDELHRVARRELHLHGRQMTLGATDLLHETWLSLQGRGARFAGRAPFFAYAARAMRGLIIDRLRARRALKRGGAFVFTAWDTEGAEGALATGEVDALADAIAALERADPALAELVDLHFFGGLDLAEIAQLRGVSERTVQRHWDKARLFLRHALRQE